MPDRIAVTIGKDEGTCMALDFLVSNYGIDIQKMKQLLESRRRQSNRCVLDAVNNVLRNNKHMAPLKLHVVYDGVCTEDFELYFTLFDMDKALALQKKACADSWKVDENDEGTKVLLQERVGVPVVGPMSMGTVSLMLQKKVFQYYGFRFRERQCRDTIFFEWKGQTLEEAELNGSTSEFRANHNQQLKLITTFLKLRLIFKPYVRTLNGGCSFPGDAHHPLKSIDEVEVNHAFLRDECYAGFEDWEWLKDSGMSLILFLFADKPKTGKSTDVASVADYAPAHVVCTQGDGKIVSNSSIKGSDKKYTRSVTFVDFTAELLERVGPGGRLRMFAYEVVPNTLLINRNTLFGTDKAEALLHEANVPGCLRIGTRGTYVKSDMDNPLSVCTKVE